MVQGFDLIPYKFMREITGICGPLIRPIHKRKTQDGWRDYILKYSYNTNSAKKLLATTLHFKYL